MSDVSGSRSCSPYRHPTSWTIEGGELDNLIPTSYSVAWVFQESADRRPTHLYIHGGLGEGNRVTSALQVVTLRDRTVTSLQPITMPAARCRHSVAVSPNSKRAYIYGGTSPELVHRDLWYYDPAAAFWREESSLGDSPGKRSGHGSAFDNDGRYLYVVGGQNERGTPSGSVWHMELTSKLWRQVRTAADVISPRATFGFCLFTPGEEEGSAAYEAMKGSTAAFEGPGTTHAFVSHGFRKGTESLVRLKLFPDREGIATGKPLLVKGDHITAEEIEAEQERLETSAKKKVVVRPAAFGVLGDLIDLVPEAALAEIAAETGQELPKTPKVRLDTERGAGVLRTAAFPKSEGYAIGHHAGRILEFGGHPIAPGPLYSGAGGGPVDSHYIVDTQTGELTVHPNEGRLPVAVARVDGAATTQVCIGGRSFLFSFGGRSAMDGHPSNILSVVDIGGVISLADPSIPAQLQIDSAMELASPLFAEDVRSPVFENPFAFSASADIGPDPLLTLIPPPPDPRRRSTMRRSTINVQQGPVVVRPTKEQLLPFSRSLEKRAMAERASLSPSRHPTRNSAGMFMVAPPNAMRQRALETEWGSYVDEVVGPDGFKVAPRYNPLGEEIPVDTLEALQEESAAKRHSFLEGVASLCDEFKGVDLHTRYDRLMGELRPYGLHRAAIVDDQLLEVASTAYTTLQSAKERHHPDLVLQSRKWFKPPIVTRATNDALTGDVHRLPVEDIATLKPTPTRPGPRPSSARQPPPPRYSHDPVAVDNPNRGNTRSRVHSAAAAREEKASAPKKKPQFNHYCAKMARTSSVITPRAIMNAVPVVKQMDPDQIPEGMWPGSRKPRPPNSKVKLTTRRTMRF